MAVDAFDELAKAKMGGTVEFKRCVKGVLSV